MCPPVFQAAHLTHLGLYNCWLPARHTLQNTPDQPRNAVVTYSISPASWTVKTAQLTFHLLHVN